MRATVAGGSRSRSLASRRSNRLERLTDDALTSSTTPLRASKRGRTSTPRQAASLSQENEGQANRQGERGEATGAHRSPRGIAASRERTRSRARAPRRCRRRSPRGPRDRSGQHLLVPRDRLREALVEVALGDPPELLADRRRVEPLAVDLACPPPPAAHIGLDVEAGGGDPAPHELEHGGRVAGAGVPGAAVQLPPCQR